VRSPVLIFSGLLAAVLFILLSGSGLWIATYGQSEALAWVNSVHTVTAYAVIAALVVHIAGHVIIKISKRKGGQSRTFITVEPGISKKLLLSTVGYGLAIVVASLTYVISSGISAKDQQITDYSYDYGEHPFRPSQTETISGKFIKPAQIANSEQCGGCHQDIYRQWISSTHRQAASDPAYVKNINLLESSKGITATRYCEGCHAPVALLTGELTPGGKHGGIPGTAGHLEGVGCMGCHGIESVVHLNGTASYRFDPREFYLFDSSEVLAAQLLRNFLIRIQPDQHKIAMGSDIIRDPKLCASCHEQFMDKSMNNWGWVKMQSVYTDWVGSPFSGQHALSSQSETIRTCQNCHFPKVSGKDPSADQDGLLISHRSLGANTVLPLLNGDREQLEATKQFLQSSKVLVDIEEPRRKDSVQSLEFVQQGLRPKDYDNTPFFLYLNEDARIKVSVTNHKIGHSFPSGTTDINQAWLHFKVTDADDYAVYESGALNDQNELDQDAHIYHSVPVDRNGAHVWKHDLFRMTGNAYKNVISPGKSDIKEYRFRVPAWAKNPLTVSAVVRYRKFNQRYAKWSLDHPDPKLPIIDMALDSMTIPLRIRPVIQNLD
jgi:hypothetical protein